MCSSEHDKDAISTVCGRNRRRLLQAVGSVGVAGLTGCAGDGQNGAIGDRTAEPTPDGTQTPAWGDKDGTSSYRVDLANTGNTEEERGPVTDAEAKWTRSIGSVSNMTPVVSKGTVFAGDGGGIRPFGTNAGTPGGNGIGVIDSTPTVQNDRVYVGGHAMRRLLILQRDPMIQGWHFDTGGALSSPAVVDETVYIGSEDRHVYAVSPPAEENDEYQPQGTKEWSFKIDAEQSAAAGGTPVSSPAVVEGTVYVNTFEKFYALDAAEGSVQWSTNAVYGTPVVADDTIYITSSGGVQAISTADGSEFWLSDVGGNEAAAVTSQGIYVALRSLYKLDPTDGSVIWKVTPDEPGTETEETDAQGTADAMAKLRSQLGVAATPPVVASGTVYVGFQNAMYAVDATDGTVLWTYETEEPFVQTPAVADGELYFTSNERDRNGEGAGTLHAVREP
jgi:outer membrane protein assembly factor BamB